MNTIDGIIEDLESEETHIGGCTTEGEIIICIKELKRLREENKRLQEQKEKALMLYKCGVGELEDTFNRIKNIKKEIEKYRDSIPWDKTCINKFETINHILEDIIEKYERRE